MRIFLGLVAAVIATVALTSPARAQAPPAFPGFSCERLAKRQPLTGAPGTTFRVAKLTFTPEFKGSEHRHPGGEIVYLLSGSGSLKRNGTVTQLSKENALYIPGGAYHDFRPAAGSTLSVLVVQFADKTASHYQPRVNTPAVCQD